MDEKFTYWASVTFSALALILLVTNIALINGNHTTQGEVSQRQGQITSGANLGQLNQSLIQALAEAAVTNNDDEVRKLLADQGITVKAKGAKNAAAADDADTKETKKK